MNLLNHNLGSAYHNCYDQVKYIFYKSSNLPPYYPSNSTQILILSKYNIFTFVIATII